ncbi:Uncharacterised protein [Mycobacteroides abscessus subsp. abscessus]|nr:Uncharacterised protein [Mycobacteroides abscessus subsp. abscessus]
MPSLDSSTGSATTRCTAEWMPSAPTATSARSSEPSAKMMRTSSAVSTMSWQGRPSCTVPAGNAPSKACCNSPRCTGREVTGRSGLTAGHAGGTGTLSPCQVCQSVRRICVPTARTRSPNPTSSSARRPLFAMTTPAPTSRSSCAFS